MWTLLVRDDFLPPWRYLMIIAEESSFEKKSKKKRKREEEERHEREPERYPKDRAHVSLAARVLCDESERAHSPGAVSVVEPTPSSLPISCLTHA